MGIQIHATDNYRRVVELIQGERHRPRDARRMSGSRAPGACRARRRRRRITTSSTWPSGPKKADPIPKFLDWDFWLGPAALRPFNTVYFPGPKWYRWWDFGNGTMSDLGSHRNDLPFWALKLRSAADGRGAQRHQAAPGDCTGHDDRDLRIRPPRRHAGGETDLVSGRR